jgi:DNA-binding response OmpR family regulator
MQSLAPIKLSSPLKFLIVDDSRAIQAIIRRAITNCGYEPIEIKTAIDGEQALEIIETFTPNLIITDWHMPKVSGLEMVQTLRQMGHYNLRVGFVTTEKTPSLLDQAKSNGAVFILHKPFDDAELVSVVTAAIKDIADITAAEAATFVIGGKSDNTSNDNANTSVNTIPVASSQKKRAEDPVTFAAMQMQLLHYLGNIPFRLIPDDRMVYDKLTTNNLLGLYASSDRKGVYAIGVMDANAICMVGGGAARKSPMEVRAAMHAEQPEDLMLSKSHEFLRALSTNLSETLGEPGAKVKLAKASVVKNTFAKLSEVLATDTYRSDFRLNIPGYGEGRMAFFVMDV